MFVEDKKIDNLEETADNELKDVNEEVKNKDEKDNCKEDENQKILDETIEQNVKLLDENERIKNELDTLKERLVSTVAEYDNYRKRTAKEKEGIYTDACEDVLKEILPVMDNLERALTSEGEVNELKTGVEMTLKQFRDSLSKLGVEEISVEDGFDPAFHNAVMHIEDESYEKNQVVEVFLRGYKRGEKVIRHSMVKVAN